MANIKTKKRVLFAVLSFLSFLFVLSVSLLCYQAAYAGKIYKNVSVAGTNLSGKTKLQAKTIIENAASPLLSNELIVKSGDKTYQSKFSDTGIHIDADYEVQRAYSEGRSGNFFKSVFSSAKTIVKKTPLNYNTNFDSDLYKNYLTKAAENLNIPPTDASLSIKNGEITANAGTGGITVDSTNLKKEIAQRFASKENSVTIEMPTMPVSQTLFSDDLANAKKQAESFLNHQLQIILNNNTYNADKTTIGGWIVFSSQNKAYTASLDSAAIKTYVNKLAAKNDTPVIDIKVNAVDNAIIQEGRQGIYTDQDDAVKKITAALNSSTTSATIQLVQNPRDPQIVKVFPDEGIIPGRFPGKYVDISLSSQLLTMFEGTNMIAQYQVSTGKASMPTPTGLRSIIDKNPRAWSAPYGLWMPWWNGIGGGMGIHELPEWPGGYKEGENHLGTPVSHGCIRLGVGPAQTFYNWADIGIPVYIHK